MVRQKTPVPEPWNVDKGTIYVVSKVLWKKYKITNDNSLYFQLVPERCNFTYMCTNMP